MLTSLDSALTLTNVDPLSLDSLPPDDRQRLLRVPLGDTVNNSVLLPLEQIAEILKVDLAEILPVPQMPSCVLGICNWRGEMLWLIDLNHFAGYTPLSQHNWRDRTSTLQGDRTVNVPVALVVQVNNQSLGLVVSYIYDIELHQMQQLQPATPGLFPPTLLPFLEGYLPGSDGAVLSIQAIAQSPLWQTHKDSVA